MIKRLTYFFVLTCGIIIGQSPFTTAKQMTASGNYERSLSILDSCVRKKFFEDSAIYYSAIVNLKMNNVKEAGQYHSKLVKEYPGFEEAHYLEALILFEEKNYNAAIDEFSVDLKHNPSHLNALFNRSLAFGMIGQYPFAIKDLEECIKLDPAFTQAHYSKAYWNEFIGNYTEAAKDYEQAIKLDPKNLDAYLGLAFVYKNQNDVGRACETINRAIEAGSQIAEEIKSNYCR